MTEAVFPLSPIHSSVHDQLSNPDCDSGPSCQGEDLYLQEADSLS